MNISLDYDETYTRDPIAWDEMIKLFRSRGHTVYVVTMRHGFPSDEAYGPSVALREKVDAIFYTGRKAKKPYMEDQGLWIDVWIDDMPIFVFKDA
jgi:hypothetical protein